MAYERWRCFVANLRRHYGWYAGDSCV